MLAKLDMWHRTKLGLVVFALIELAVSYGLASWAIDSGSLWLYAAALIFIVGVLQNFVRLIGKFVHGSSTRQA